MTDRSTDPSSDTSPSAAPRLAPVRRRRRGQVAAIGYAALASAVLVSALPALQSSLNPQAAADRSGADLSGDVTQDRPTAPVVPLVGVAERAATAPLAPVSAVRRFIARQAARGLDCSISTLQLPVCTHGRDDYLRDAPPYPAAATVPAGDGEEVLAAGSSTGSTGTAPRVGCYGDGTSGPRIRAVYARPQGSPDRYASSLASLRSYAGGADAVVDAAARATNGTRHLRFATTAPTSDGSCQLAVQPLELPSAAFATMRALVDALQVRGLKAARSKYLVWTESSVMCGVATMLVDDKPTLDNLNNGELPGYARVDRPCWGKAEVHELVHVLGGVQPSAPHSTAGYHCNDGADALCYADGTARSTQRSICAVSSTQRLDCRHDDYFSTSAPRGSYLQTRWNVARSSFLAAAWTDPTPPPAAPAPTASEPTGTEPAMPPSPSAAPAPSPSPTSSPPSPAPSPSSGGPAGAVLDLVTDLIPSPQPISPVALLAGSTVRTAAGRVTR